MWSKLQAQLPPMPTLSGAPQLSMPNMSGLNIGSSLKTGLQASRERFGQVSADEITELPKEYKDLEARVDALKNVHQAMLKITGVYTTESYDYPTQITESVAELGGQLSYGINAFAQKNLKNTSLPLPAASAPPAHPHKTLPHALARAATAGATELGEDRLGGALKAYGAAQAKIGEARLSQDEEITTRFVHPFQKTLSTSIAIAVRARNSVKQARLELDSARQILKNAGVGPKGEQARLDVENAEDKLVQATEVAIGQMKNVLENPEAIANLNSLVKAQLVFHSTAAEALAAVQGEIEEASVAAEGEYRASRV
ncbi:BAR domain-containing family protein [Mrakia frigida]|uniref:BAR domain-containing family protein n=1 Tax=Mrakia frigida TaxID=29902 RepID=UPI003FCBF884